MAPMSPASYGVALWVVLQVFGTSQSSGDKADVRRTRESLTTVQGGTNNLLPPPSQPSTGSLSQWSRSEGSVIGHPTHPLTHLPWWPALSATPPLEPPTKHGAPASTFSLLQYLVTHSLPPSTSFTNAPHFLPLPIRYHPKTSPSGVTKESSPDKVFLHHSIPSPENVNRMSGHVNEENDVGKLGIKNDLVVLSRQERATHQTYESPLDVVSYGPTSHFFMHELLQPHPQLELEMRETPSLKSDPESLQHSSRNAQGSLVYSGTVFYPDYTTTTTTTSSSIRIHFPTERSYPTTFPDYPTTQTTDDYTVTDTTPPTPPDAGVTDNRVIIDVPCHGHCKVSTGRVCFTDFSCLGRNPVK